MFNFHEKKDTKLRKDILDELSWDPSISSDQISVTANGGVITLRGTVPHYFEKTKAEQIVQRVSGVRAIADEIEVKFMEPSEKSDDEIALAVVNALDWNYLVPKGLNTVVTDGWVTLSGETTWDYQRMAAENDVTRLMGVRGVSNEIKITPRPQSFDIKNRIEESLRRFADDESDNIKVLVERDTVTLSGKVHSLSESTEACTAAWNAPGVMNVINDIRISN